MTSLARELQADRDALSSTVELGLPGLVDPKAYCGTPTPMGLVRMHHLF